SRREARADDERMALDAAQVLVHVLRRGLDALRPARPDKDLPSLGVDGADHHGRELRIRGLGLAADVSHIVRDGTTDVAPPEGDRHRNREGEGDGSGQTRDAARAKLLDEPHARRASFNVVSRSNDGIVPLGWLALFAIRAQSGAAVSRTVRLLRR